MPEDKRELVALKANVAIRKENVEAAEKVLVDNGIEPDEADTVLQALCYALLDLEIHPGA